MIHLAPQSRKPLLSASGEYLRLRPACVATSVCLLPFSAIFAPVPQEVLGELPAEELQFLLACWQAGMMKR